VTLVASGCSCRGSTAFVISPAPPPGAGYPASAAVMSAGAGDTIIHARFRNVRFHFWPGVALRIDELFGRMRSRRADGVVSFDDPRSFVLDIDTASVALPTGDLSRLMNTYVFAYRGAPLRDLAFSIEGGHLVQRGILHKVVDIPFETTADLSVTPESEIRIHTLSMKICSIPGKGLMDALGVTLAKLLDLRQAKGVRVAGNDLFLDPTKLLPPPAIAGKLVQVRLDSDAVVQYFGGGAQRIDAAAMQPDSAAPNYMLFRGGTLQFGKLFMVHTDMQVIDLAPVDLFDFDLSHYREQLVAGYHRTLPDDGLLVFMPDLSALAHASGAATALP
jgi:hypothetical protein